jgi:hypothetical protein
VIGRTPEQVGRRYRRASRGAFVLAAAHVVAAAYLLATAAG